MAYRNGKWYDPAYPYEEVCRYLELYKKAKEDIVNGQVREYGIGTRYAKMLSLEEIEAEIRKFAAIKEKYETNTRPARSVAVVFRDT